MYTQSRKASFCHLNLSTIQFGVASHFYPLLISIYTDIYDFTPCSFLAKFASLNDLVLISALELQLVAKISLRQAEEIQMEASRHIYPITQCTGKL